MTRTTQQNVYGPGTFTDTSFVPVPEDCKRLLQYFVSRTPGFTQDAALLKKVHFHGGDLPILPGSIKAQVLSAVLAAMIGITASEISTIKGIDSGNVTIDTDHAGMFPATPVLVTVGGKGLAELSAANIPRGTGADLDRGVLESTPMRYRTWAIYPTKDPKVWYQILSSFDPLGVLSMFGLEENAASTRDEAYETIKAETTKYSAAELELMCMSRGICGQTCYTPEAWRQTSMGKSLARHPMINYRKVPNMPDLPVVPFKVMSSDKRPLAGIKVVEMSRVIAAPAMGMLLASLGADVIRVQPPHLHDVQSLSLALTAGKHTCGLNLNQMNEKEYLYKLIEEADVFIQAFRLGSIGRRGFGHDELMKIANKRGRGIVYVDLNCYGLDGYYAERPGFQQIADAASGCSYVCGKAYGFPEGTGVLPSLPIADMLSGAVGVIDVLLALRDRAKEGGSYLAHVALTTVDTEQLQEEVGLYPPETVKQVQDKFHFDPQTPDLMVGELLAVVAKAWSTSSDLMERNDFFVTFADTPFGKNHRILAPVTRFDNDEVQPKWDFGPVPYCWETHPSFK